MEALDRIAAYTSGGREAFIQIMMVQDATVRNFEIVRKTTNNLSAALREPHPKVPWAKLARMRDVLIHNYMGVDLEVVWGAVEDEIYPLNAKLLAILKKPGEV